MCPPPEPCSQYRPNYRAMEAAGQLCTGFGYSPPCLGCGLDERAHAYGVSFGSLVLDVLDSLGHDTDSLVAA